MADPPTPASPTPDAVPPDQVDTLVRVLERSRAVGFLGDGPVVDHIDHALGFARALPTMPRHFLDLGSGGGVPGLVLAVVWPGVTATLLDAQEKRCAVLRDAILTLGLTERVSVARGRAEELGRQADLRGQFDLVTARSFGPPAVVAECAAPFLAQDGHLVVSEPPEGGDRWPAASLAELGLRPEPATDAGTNPVRIRVITQVAPLPDRFPRRVGIPTKRPLF